MRIPRQLLAVKSNSKRRQVDQKNLNNDFKIGENVKRLPPLFEKQDEIRFTDHAYISMSINLPKFFED